MEYLIFFVVLSTLSGGVSCCTKGFMDLELMIRKAPLVDSDNNGLDTQLSINELRIITNMTFTCSGNLTSMILGIELRRPDLFIRNLYPQIQLWRPSNDNITYQKVTAREVILSPANFSTDGATRFEITPPIEFNEGDVLGVYQPALFRSVVIFYYTEVQAPVLSLIANPTDIPSTVNLTSFTPVTQSLLIYPITDPPGACATGFLDMATVLDISKDTQPVQRSGFGFQRIYPGIQFTCNGAITKWTIGAFDIIFNSVPELQVWRLVGENYIKVSSSLFRPNETNNQNIHVFYPKQALEFQSGDIFGVHTPNDFTSDLSLLFQRFNGPENFEFPMSAGSPAPTSIPALSLRPVVENNYPLVTLEVTMSTTPILPSMTVTMTNTVSPLSTTSIPLTTVQPLTNLPSMTVTMTNTVSTPPNNAIYLIVGVVGGALFIIVLLVMVILVIVCVYKRYQKNKKAGTFQRTQNSLHDNPSYNTNIDTYLYSSYQQYSASENGTVRNNHTSSVIYETVDDDVEDVTINTDTNPSYMYVST